MHDLTTAAMTDRQLWQRLRDDASQSAFAELFRRYNAVVYNFAQRRLGDWSDAEEVTQTTFTLVWQRAVDRRLTALSTDSAMGLFLWLTRNAIEDHRRRTTRRLKLVRSAASEVRESSDPVGDWVETTGAEAELHKAIASLPADQREIIDLIYWGDVPLTEVAVALGIPVGTAKSRVSRARAALKSHPAAEIFGGVS